ncbi:MAG: glycosyltransferase family 1 protein, partial [Cytophagaceae bacterium]
MSRATANYRVWFLEEPVWSDQTQLSKYQPTEGVTVLTPHIPHHTPADEAIRLQRQLLDEFISENQLNNFVAWYYTPMALLFSDHIKPRLTIYDCMDELSAFWGAPPQLLQQEQRLIDRSAIVFTGGISLFEAKQNRHPQVMAFPSSIDFNHFSTARQSLPDPADQASVARPRIGFSGVIDERFDYELVTKLAAQHPDWQFVLI